MTIPPETIATAREKSILDVANRLGARLKKKGGEWNGPCPGCGGTDRFWLDEPKNTFLCRMSGAAGDPIHLLRHVHGCGFAEAVEMLTGEKALPARERSARPDDDNRYREKARRRAYRVWQSGLAAGDLVRAYLAIRGIRFPAWRLNTIRETPQLAYWQWSKARQEFVIIHSGPAMLAAITGPATPDHPTGHFIGVHRTWLDLARPNGKAEIFCPDTGEQLAAKKVEGSQRGGRIVLRDRAFGVKALALGEGIETTLSWDDVKSGTSGQEPALWCGINLDNIAGKAAEQVPHPSKTVADSLGRQRRVKVGGPNPDAGDLHCLHIPHGIFDRLTLLGDGDGDHFATQSAMLRAERRHAAPGLEVSTDWAPDGMDWSDFLLASRAVRPAAGIQGRAA